MEEEWSPLCVVAAPKNCRSALYVAKGYGGTRNRLGLVSGGGKVHPRTLGMATTPQNGLLAVGLKAVSVLPPTRSSNRWRPRRAGVIRVRSNRPTLVPTTVHSGVHARSAPRHPPMAWPTRSSCCRFDPFAPANMLQNEQIRGSSFLPSARRTSARQGRGWRESACTDLNLWLHPRERRRGGCWCYRRSDTLMVCNHESHQHGQSDQYDDHHERGPSSAVVGARPRFVVHTYPISAARPPLAPQLKCVATTTTASRQISQDLVSALTTCTRTAGRVHWCYGLARAAGHAPSILVLARGA